MCCKVSQVRNNQSSAIGVEYETDQVCDGGYALVNGGRFFDYKGSILKDTCNVPFTAYLQAAKSNYIPTINDILSFENALEGKKLTKFYRLYSGFINHQNDTIIEAILLQPSIIRKRGDSWKSERYQVGASPPFPKKMKKKVAETVFYFSLKERDLVRNSEVLQYKFD